MAAFNLNQINASPGTGEIIRAVVEDGGVIGARIEDGGTGHNIGDTLTITGTGINATGTVSSVSGGAITGVNITSPGSG